MASYYWSSTTFANSTGYAWGVTSTSATCSYYDKTDYYYVRAVRGGQCGSFGDLVISFLEKGVAPSRTVVGAAADGASEAVIRVSGLNQFDVVDISLPGDGSDGVMQNDGAWSIADNNTWIYKQTYRAPDKFVKSSEDETIGNRAIDLQVRVNGAEVFHSPFYLHKAPVVLVHGIWSKAKTWDDMAGILKEDYGFEYVTQADYKDTNAVYFSSNSSVVNSYINKILKHARERDNIAVKKADVVGHSMGGMLTKLYGDASKIRSITTVGTPHYGSPLANLVWGLVDDYNKFIENTIAGLFAKIKHPVRDGAIEDLRTGSGGVHCEWDKIGSDDNNHIIAGISPLTNQEVILVVKLLANVCKLYGILPAAATVLDLNQFIFGGERNDWVVSESSQEGGSPYGIDDSVWWHISETGDEDIMEKIANILNGTDDYRLSSFESFSIKQPVQPAYSPFAGITIPVMDAAPGTVTIVSPIEGQNFQPGDTVSVTVSASNPQAMLLISASSGESTLLEQAPYVWAFTVPMDAMGDLIITAAATDETGFIGTDAVTINIASSATLTALEIFPDIDPLYLDMGSHEQFTVYGTYSNTNQQDVTAAAETTYQSSNTTVATIDTNGLVTCIGGGETTITVTNGGIIQTKQVVVTVDEPTVVNLSKFTATGKKGKIMVQWSSESETDNAGFNIYRSEAKDGPFKKMNNALIVAKGSSTQGASYEFTDTNVQNRKTYYYKLEDIDLNGTSTMHGLVSATPRIIYGLGK